MTLKNTERTKSARSETGCEEHINLLVSSATGGNISSFDDLVRSYKHTVLSIGRRMSGNMCDAEDIAQQTFMKVFMNLAAFRKESSLSTWLISIARNEALMWKRKQSRRREMPLVAHVHEGTEMPLPVEIPDQRPDPEFLCFAKECDTLLNAKLAQLKPEMRMALQFCDLQENSMHGTAQILGTTVIAVKSRRRRARLALRAKLERHLSSAQLGSTSFK